MIKCRIPNHHGETSAPALGLMFLGAAARAWSGWDVRALDLYLEEDLEQAIANALEAFPADVVGVSALTSESKCMHEAARIVRRLRPDATILAGGAHPSAYPEECLENECIEGVCLGEGEVTMCEVLELIARDEPWADVPGMMTRKDDGDLHLAPQRANIEDLDLLPMPAFDLTDIDAYSRRRGQALVGMRRYLPMMTSRGCPYRCTYCHDIQGKRFRSHSPEYVLEMIDYMARKFDVHSLDIIDDIFNFDADRMGKICDGLIAREQKITFGFPNGIRADRMTPEQVDQLGAAGCEFAAVAIETATKRLQKYIRKNLRFDKVLPVVAAFDRNEILVCGFFMLGFHTESRQDIQNTIDYALGSKLHAARFFVVTPFQGTELFGQVHGELDEADHANMKEGYVRQKINLSEVPDDEFFAMRKKAYLKFYGNADRIRRIWKSFPRKRALGHYGAIWALHTLRIPPGDVFGPLDRAANALRGLATRLTGWAPESRVRNDVPRQVYVLPDTPKVPEHLFVVSRKAKTSEKKAGRRSLRLVS